VVHQEEAAVEVGQSLYLALEEEVEVVVEEALWCEMMYVW